jgi:tryptophan-rich sensory protein
VVSLCICALAAAAEAVLSGKQPLDVLATLRLPRFTPPRWAWITIALFYYAICFTVLAHLLQMDGGNRLQYSAIVLTIVLLALNALFNYMLFRRRNLFSAFLLFIPYDLVAVGLQICLFRLDNTTGYIFVPYLAYLVFATAWGYQVWRLNQPNEPRS